MRSGWFIGKNRAFFSIIYISNLPENTAVFLSKFHEETLAIFEKSFTSMKKTAFRSLKSLRNQYIRENADAPDGEE